MNNEQKFFEDIKSLDTKPGLANQLVHYLVERKAELGDDDYKLLQLRYAQLSELIQMEMQLIEKEFILGRNLTTRDFKTFHKFILQPYYGTIPQDCVDEMEWRYQCLKKRAIPSLYTR